MGKRYLPTGNEMISIPKLNEATAGIEDITFLHMGFKGLVELRGGEDTALIEPFVEAEGSPVPLSDIQWERLQFWVPRFSGAAGPLRIEGTILTPVKERGFVYRLQLRNPGRDAQTVSFGLRGCWSSAWHCVNEDKEIVGAKYCYSSPWNDSLIFDMRCGVPLFCFAPMSSDNACLSTFEETEQGMTYRLEHTCTLKAGESKEVVIYWGLGFEEVAAATSAKEMLRQGYQYEEAVTLAWLRSRTYWIEDKELQELYNTNLFFCIFFSTGTTLDTEELVLVTSRSPRYYVSAAYWDRDSLLWSFPAILDVDRDLARQMLEYVFGPQQRNIGVHSRYIDGTVLEPGFELDELMAPVLALERYIDATGDRVFLTEANVKKGIRSILGKLNEKRNAGLGLYETFLQPTDDERVYPYLTYDNALVWKGLRAIAWLYPEEYGSLENEAEEVSNAIWRYSVKEEGGKRFFAWSVDAEGRYDIYDEPPGSLQLLPSLGFCKDDDEVYRNTVELIRAPNYAHSFAGYPFAEIGCPHAPHPWLLSVANSLLCGRVEGSLDILRRAGMDNGIICESIDEHTGVCATGEAFATCAGFVCHGIRVALGMNRNGE
ncbi:glycoside hydrolase family 125 protein [Lawsonibacter hominis]|uniref:glycoside hydrolase family 125 protein n=1 Tax=Lawsonibacter hominis TaxID=2763053 RepID=UPI0033300138